MSTFSITTNVPAGESHSELLNEIELADLPHEDAQAARTAMNAALSFFNHVGDASVDPGISVKISGESDKSLTVTVKAIPVKEAPLAMNVPNDANVPEEEPKDKLGYAVAGQNANPQTGDPLIDNVPGHPDAPPPVESVPEPQELQDPQVIEMLEAHDVAPESVDIENPLYHTSEEALAAVGDTEGVVVDTEGSAADVIASVDGDPEKARAALEVEQASDKPRKGLVSDLEKIVGGES